jgi:DNA-binding NtrC family response regulator
MEKEKGSLLILDDEEMIRDLLTETFTARGYSVDTAKDGKAANKKIDDRRYDLLITDLRLPDISGMDILTRARKKYPEMGIIMITAYGSIKNAVNVMKEGAFYYIAKPFELEEIEIAVGKYFEFNNLKAENQYLRSELDKKFSFQNIIGNSEPMQRIYECIKMVAKSKATVLIQGKSGTGKELVARAIHYNSNRKMGPFITTNCAAIPDGLVESELFGHEKGAFTGAYRTTKGRFEMADGGTLLLDEISEISFGLQAKLLRVLQEREIERVGGGKLISVDVRIIATTNKDLQAEVDEKRFREDLYYRLNVVPIHLPVISQRREDIPLLVYHFLEKYSTENGNLKKDITEKAMKMLCQKEWQGNVREIENCIERAVVMSPQEIKSLDIRNFFVEKNITTESYSVNTENQTLRESEKTIILKTLKENNHNRTKTAELLDISVRTLRNKINEYRKEGIQIL